MYLLFYFIFTFQGEECRKIFQEKTQDKKEKEAAPDAGLDESSSGATDKEDVLVKKQLPKKTGIAPPDQISDDLDHSWPDKDELLPRGVNHKKEHVPFAHHDNRDYGTPTDHRTFPVSRHHDYPTPGSSTSDYGTAPSETGSYSERSYGSSKDYGYHGSTPSNHSAHSTPISYDYHNHYPSAPPPTSHSTHYPSFHPQTSQHHPRPPIAPPPPPPPPPYGHQIHPPPHTIQTHMPPPPIHHTHPLAPPIHSASQQWQQSWSESQPMLPIWEQSARPIQQSALRHIPVHSGTVTTLPPANATPTWTPVAGDGRNIVFSPERGSGKKDVKPSGKGNASQKSSESLSPETPKVLDLDTRIEMLLKGKGAGGLAPPFLQLGISSDSEEDTPIKSVGKISSRRSSGSSSKHGSSRHRHSSSCHHLDRSQQPSQSSSSSDTDGATLPPLPLTLSLPPPPGVDEPLPPPPSFDRADQAEALSTPPSPFLSAEIYLKWHQIGIEQARKAREKEQEETTGLLESVNLNKPVIDNDDLGSIISSSEDETLTATHIDKSGKTQSEYFSPQQQRQQESSTEDSDQATEPAATLDLPPRVVPEGGSSRKSTPLQDEHRDDDRMSLSSLSSGDEKIEVASQPPVNMYPAPPPYTMYPPHPYPPPPYYHPPPAPLYPGAAEMYAWTRAPAPGSNYPYPPMMYHLPPPPPGYPANTHYPPGITPLGTTVHYGYPSFHPRFPQTQGQIPYESTDPQAPTIK